MQTWPSELWRHSAKQLNMWNLNTLYWSRGEETITANTKKATEKNTTIMEENCINVLIYPLVSSRLACLKTRNKPASMPPFTSAVQAWTLEQSGKEKKINKGHQGWKGVKYMCPCALALCSSTEGSTRSGQHSQMCGNVPGHEDDEQLPTLTSNNLTKKLQNNST